MTFSEENPWFLTHPLLSALPGVTHGFFGRQGGVSDGALTSLNCAYSAETDTRENVAENRRRIVWALGDEGRLATLSQVHSAKVVMLEKPLGEPQEADALVTATPGLLLGILTADCGPVLLADAEAGVVGAAHAGWKGALTGVLEATLEAMQALGADISRTTAVLGPHIRQESYEVDAAFRERFLDVSAGNATFFLPGIRENRFQFSLGNYIEYRLTQAGLTNVAQCAEDTYADAERWFSYRRSCHRQEPDYGRQISIIGLRKPTIKF